MQVILMAAFSAMLVAAGVMLYLPIIFGVIPLLVGFVIGLIPREPEPKPESKWFTVGRMYAKHKFADCSDTYSVEYLLRVTPTGQRKVVVSSPSHHSTYNEHIIEWAKREEEYVLYLEPWQSGLLSIETVSQYLPKKLKLVPHPDLASLEENG